MGTASGLAQGVARDVPPNGPQVTGHEWSTFNGTWFFVIPPQMGRVRVRVQKVVELKTDEIALLLVITTRGEIGDQGVSDWSSGLELGHRSAVRVFFDIASPEAGKNGDTGNDAGPEP